MLGSKLREASKLLDLSQSGQVKHKLRLLPLANPEIPVIIFVVFFFSFNNKKTPKSVETPIFNSVLAKLKKITFKI